MPGDTSFAPPTLPPPAVSEAWRAVAGPLYAWKSVRASPPTPPTPTPTPTPSRWAVGVLIYEMVAGYPPFHQEDRVAMFRAICACQFNFPSHFSKVRGEWGDVQGRMRLPVQLPIALLKGEA